MPTTLVQRFLRCGPRLRAGARDRAAAGFGDDEVHEKVHLSADEQRGDGCESGPETIDDLPRPRPPEASSGRSKKERMTVSPFAQPLYRRSGSSRPEGLPHAPPLVVRLNPQEIVEEALRCPADAIPGVESPLRSLGGCRAPVWQLDLVPPGAGDAPRCDDAAGDHEFVSLTCRSAQNEMVPTTREMKSAAGMRGPVPAGSAPMRWHSRTSSKRPSFTRRGFGRMGMPPTA